MWLKMQLQGLRWYLGSDALAKVKYCESVEEMFTALGRRRCVVPNYVYQMDVETEGILLTKVCVTLLFLTISSRCCPLTRLTTRRVIKWASI